MRIASRGIIGIDVCTSISYNADSGVVNVLLQGCSTVQQKGIARQLCDLYTLTGHPLLLPLVLVDVKVSLLEEEELRLWRALLDVETFSQQSGTFVSPSPDIKARRLLRDSDMDDEKVDDAIQTMTIDVLRVLQLTSYAESHAKALLASIALIKKEIEEVGSITNSSRRAYIHQVGGILEEKLDLLAHRTQIVIEDLMFVEKRAQAQQSAVSPFTNSLSITTYRAYTTQGIQLYCSIRCKSPAGIGSFFWPDRPIFKEGQLGHESHCGPHNGVSPGNLYCSK
jgi:hypothetical protein